MYQVPSLKNHNNLANKHFFLKSNLKREVTKSAESWLHIVIYPAGAREGEQEAGEVQQPAAFFAFSFFFFNSPPAAHNFLLHPLVLTFSEVQLFKKGCLLLVASCLGNLFSEASSNLYYPVNFTCTNVLTRAVRRQKKAPRTGAWKKGGALAPFLTLAP